MKHFALVPILLLAGCSKGSEQTSEPAAKQAVSEAGIAAKALPTIKAAAHPASRYTAFKDCKLVEGNPDEDWSHSHCPGVAGYDLEIDYGDARDELVLKVPGKPPVAMGLFKLGGGGFNALGETAEWRGTETQDGFAPTALIVRDTISEDPEDSSKQTSVLVVIDLSVGCVVAQVRPQAGQNETARAIADGPARQCLTR